jgi:6-phosphogluconolactonase/glucosamine-6-phosphate isomerase/deaminase
MDYTFNRKLIEPPYDKIVDWAKWYVFWADERVVAKNHDDSNYKLAKDNLLSKVRLFGMVLDDFWIEESCILVVVLFS